MKILLKLIMAFTFLISFNSCNRDYCKDTVCEAGTICDDGLCLLDLNQEINVDIVFNHSNQGQQKEYSSLITCETKSKFSNISIDLGEIHTHTYNQFLANSKTFIFAFNDYTFENYDYASFNIEFDDASKSKIDFRVELDIESMDIPNMNIVLNNNNELILTENSSYTSNFDNIKITIDERYPAKNFKPVFETTISSLNTSITNLSDGWILPYNGFNTGAIYKITVSPTKEYNIENKNVNYHIISQSYFDLVIYN